MKLIVHELKGLGLTQKLTPKKNTLVEAVRPHLYRHKWPAGLLTLEVTDPEGTLVGSSNVWIEDIGTQDFFHGYVRFDLNVGLKKGVEYSFLIYGTFGYAFSESAYIGWCNGYDLGKYKATYSVATSLNAPLDLEVWERTTK